MTQEKNFKKFFQKTKMGGNSGGNWPCLGFGVFWLFGIFLILRRCFGALTLPFPVWGIGIFSFVFGGFLLVLTAYWSFLWARAEACEEKRRFLPIAFSVLVFLLTQTALWTPGTTLAAKTLSLGLSLAVVLGTAWLTEVRIWEVRIAEAKKPSLDPVPVSNALSERDEELEEELDEELDEELNEILPAGVTQQMERSATLEHGEQITGFLRGEFAPNQTKLSLFAGFCPPLTHIPSVECLVVEGDAQLEVTQALPHGFSISVKKRQRVPFGDSVLLHFTALEFGEKGRDV